MSLRNLILVLGDQLDPESTAFDGFDRQRDAVWMVEVAAEVKQAWSHKARIALFLSAMRHFRDRLRKRGFTVHYKQLDQPGNRGDFASELKAAVRREKPQRLIVTHPGEWRVKQELQTAAQQLEIDLEIRPDRHFYTTPDEFAEHAEGRKQLRLEYFYRELRKRYDVLMDGDQPAGGAWNYDRENRRSFGDGGPDEIPRPASFKVDPTTREVLDLVSRRFADHPGSLEYFNWPVTSRQAKRALRDFIQHRLANFGKYQDAMWTDEPLLFHSRLSAALNLKLLDPRDVVAAAEQAYATGRAPLNAVEGFIRQILGWREYVRGVYWLYMPEYLQWNALGADAPLPQFFWNGETDMRCLRHTIGQTLKYGYAHHIQRLMVTGLFSLLLGVDPHQVHAWYLAVYVDAVEWVEAPNTLGMSQYADGGVMASKPYAATGKYIQRMSNYCEGCCYNPALASGEGACPFTTLYWDFLMRHEATLKRNPRMALQLKNAARKMESEKTAIHRRAAELKARYTH
ncbi:MAG: cryptochrome/photolyase family protein [Pirellulaceae bacterium]